MIPVDSPADHRAPLMWLAPDRAGHAAMATPILAPSVGSGFSRSDIHIARARQSPGDHMAVMSRLEPIRRCPTLWLAPSLVTTRGQALPRADSDDVL